MLRPSSGRCAEPRSCVFVHETPQTSCHGASTMSLSPFLLSGYQYGKNGWECAEGNLSANRMQPSACLRRKTATISRLSEPPSCMLRLRLLWLGSTQLHIRCQLRARSGSLRRCMVGFFFGTGLQTQFCGALLKSVEAAPSCSPAACRAAAIAADTTLGVRAWGAWGGLMYS